MQPIATTLPRQAEIGYRRAVIAAGIGLAFALLSTSLAARADVVTASAIAGAVDDTKENSDAFIWGLMTRQIAAPVSREHPNQVMFETWASDGDVFSQSPHWPTLNEPRSFHASVLAAMRASQAPESAIDVGCAPPPNAGVGGFPTTGTPTPCIAEEVKRNWPEYEYIVGNHLNTQSGLRRAFASAFKVDLPAKAIAVKGDWVPVPTLLQWVPQARDAATVEKTYLTTRVGATEYALVALHVSSKRNPYWVWGTFEHRLNPGRCDYVGCHDSFGAVTRAVPANKQAFNTQYGACPKSAALQAMMSQAGLSPVWANYCLKGTQVDYVTADGTPQALGSSVIEGINANGPISASSCITCHSYASFGAAGTVSGAADAMLKYNATGKPIPGAITPSHRFDFTWGVLLAPK